VLCLMMSLMLTLNASSAVNDKTPAHKFCYTREQAEKINTCLEMQAVYEEIQLTRFNNPVLNPPPQLDFWSTQVGQSLIFLGGFALGVGVTVSFK